MIEVNTSRAEGRGVSAYIYRFLCIRLLDDANGCVCNEDEENYEGLDECTEKGAIFLSFYKSQNEGDQGRCEQYEDELIFELFEYQLP